jgi:uncharacterized membrane protein
MNGYAPLVTACALFVGSHFLMSHPLRARMVARLGDNGFAGVYSLVSLASFGWMIWVFRQAPTGEMVWNVSDAIWIGASLLTLLASVLFIGSFFGNPVLSQSSGAALAAQRPAGALLVTRHPMMWGFALWGVAHILVAPRMDSFIFVGSIIFLALAGAAGQDRKKAILGGDSWNHWVASTSYWPRLSQLPRIGVRLWLAGTVLWLVATWAHNFFGAYGAGIYRWL